MNKHVLILTIMLLATIGPSRQTVNKSGCTSFNGYMELTEISCHVHAGFAFVIAIHNLPNQSITIIYPEHNNISKLITKNPDYVALEPFSDNIAEIIIQLVVNNSIILDLLLIESIYNGGMPINVILFGIAIWVPFLFISIKWIRHIYRGIKLKKHQKENEKK